MPCNRVARKREIVMRRVLVAIAIVMALPVLMALPSHSAAAGGIGCGAIREQHRQDPGDTMTTIAARLCDQPDSPNAYFAGIAKDLALEVASALLHTGCTRHIYNNSGFTWAIIPNQSLMDDHMCGYGTDADNTVSPEARVESLCTVTPGVSKEIRYPKAKGKDDTEQIRILGYRGKIAEAMLTPEENGIVFDQTFDIKPEEFGQCWSIQHSGNTGNIVVNDPAAGDIATCGYQSYKCDTPVPEPTATEISDAANAMCLLQAQNPNCHWGCVDGTIVTDRRQCDVHRGYVFNMDRLHNIH
jgi:hypothetical protein